MVRKPHTKARRIEGTKGELLGKSLTMIGIFEFSIFLTWTLIASVQRSFVSLFLRAFVRAL